MSSTIEQFLSNSYDRIERICDRFVQRKYWRIELPLICLGLMYFVNFPYFQNLDPDICSTWEIVQNQIDDPTKQYGMENPSSHDSKRGFRLTVPILCKLINVRDPRMIYCIQVIVCFLFFRMLIHFAERLSASKLVNVLLPIGFSFTAIGQAGIFDVYAKFDSFALFFLFASMLFRSPAVIFLSILLAAFTDERALIASPMILLWWQLFENRLYHGSFSSLVKLNWRAIAVFLGILSYIGLRLFIAQRLGFVSPTGDVGISILARQYNMYLFGTWTAFEGFWIVVFMALFFLLYSGRHWLLILVIITALPSFVAAHLVIDITRSMIYALPLLIVCLKISSGVISSKNFDRLILASLLINLLVPTYWAFGGFAIESHNPFLLRLYGIIY